MKPTDAGERRWAPMVLAALGIVYGDIGTSPLYAMRECFSGPHAVPATPANVLGVLSLICWSLVLIVSIKYLAFVLRANNKGEGGILALLSLAVTDPNSRSRRRVILVAFGLFGAALLYGDGMITPTVTVLGAMEGLQVAAPGFESFVLPFAVATLAGLFAVQRVGTGSIGWMFGPVMVVWFVVLAVLGVYGMLRAPGVLTAVNPMHAIHFLAEQGLSGFTVLGSVFLVVTGAEALYADMGHLGIQPIRRGWFGLVLPALALNYFGQGALLMVEPGAAANPFFRLAPQWAVLPLVGLATAAAVIASQALISGAYSLTMHAVQLGFLPRMQIIHTSSTTRGQIYMPNVNWGLMVACIWLAIEFKSSSALAGAYGIAVTLTMLITTVLFYFAARNLWNWRPLPAAALCGMFLVLELVFCGANLLKIADGGWFPLAVGAGVFILMTTWRRGRELVRQRLQSATLPIDVFLESVRIDPPPVVKGTAIYMAGNPKGAPVALLHNLKHNRVLHERVIFLTVLVEESPHVEAAHAIEIEALAPGFYRVVGRYGFMDEPNIPELLGSCRTQGLEIDPEAVTFFLSRETIIPTQKPGMMLWRERLFAYLSRNAQPATAFFQLPANRVVELGMQVEM